MTYVLYKYEEEEPGEVDKEKIFSTQVKWKTNLQNFERLKSNNRCQKRG